MPCKVKNSKRNNLTRNLKHLEETHKKKINKQQKNQVSNLTL